ncbi:hypothetical protein [Methylophaga nitratireducenticrescens]|uniref:Uncharacterized protein n=1 Tax=Methylophaga nitratireducenticrescens TaxID=754476 RepID=I1XN23_METNJ|nr:hypothetical protein [Methylophaga nitratireducenticrescens]AFI85792.1 hypothetical protein Q7A_3017 [Methylophaga nitratireducenticrescens]AUZ85510.1 hypothetical protein CDW43_13455 [Methylophaga nitratireducenticrescens]
MQNLFNKIIIAIVLSSGFMTMAFAEDDGEGKQVIIDSENGKESVTIEESQTGDQSGAGSAITDDPVDDERRNDEEDNTDKPKYEE